MPHGQEQQSQLKRLQSVQNIAARLVSGTQHCDHMSPILHSLYWLTIRQRVTFKIGLLMWKCVHGAAPALQELCVPVEDSESAHGYGLHGNWTFRPFISSLSGRIQGFLLIQLKPKHQAAKRP